jgi:hypothetical protein
MVNMNKFRDPAVYALHAGDGVYAYVGSTSVNSKMRLYEHISRARRGHPSPVYEWMRSVGVENVVVVDLLKCFDPNDRLKLEAQLIVDFIAQGYPLVNRVSRDGVIGSMSEESKRLISEKQAGRPSWITGKRGVEAGWTDERREASSEPRALHGTKTRRKKHGCNCDACIWWEVEYYSDMEARRMRNQHGTAASYKHGKCRCEDCRSAYREYQRRFKKDARLFLGV